MITPVRSEELSFPSSALLLPELASSVFLRLEILVQSFDDLLRLPAVDNLISIFVSLLGVHLVPFC